MDDIYNLEYIKEISDDEVFIRDMVETFIQEAPDYFYKLRVYYGKRNFEGMLAVIHKFKNAANFIGNAKLKDELSKLSNNLHGEKDVSKIRHNLNEVDLLIGEIVQKLKKDFNIDPI